VIQTVSIGKGWFSPKVERVGTIKDFLVKSPAKTAGEAMTAGALTGTFMAILSKADMVLAGTMTDKIVNGFQPIIELIQGLSYPVGFIMISAGFLVIMTGNRQKGIHLIKWAAIGYIGMQFAPAIMTILIEVGKAIGK